jgi:hypothetical protein
MSRKREGRGSMSQREHGEGLHAVGDDRHATGNVSVLTKGVGPWEHGLDMVSLKGNVTCLNPKP